MTNNTKLTLEVVYRPTEVLKAFVNNARTHSKDQIRRIAESIAEFGFTTPVLIDATDTIIAGHGRVAAAKRLGISQVPTILLEGLTEDQIRAYVIADNRLAERAGWDKPILAIEFQHLLTIDTHFDITVTGFEVPEIDLMIEEVANTKQEKIDSSYIDETALAITQPGDLWRLGKHRLLCGNSLNERVFKALMSDERAKMVFIDPPFNVAIDGNVSGKGRISHRDFPMGSGEMSEAEFVAFLTSSLRLLSQHSTSESIHYVCIDWRHMTELLAAGKQVYNELLNLCVWVKNNGGLGSFYRSRHELIFVFKNGKGRHRNNVILGKFGRNRTNVWEYSNANSFSKQTDEGNLSHLHPTVKPVQMVADALLDCSARGDVVLDAFLGSGTTLIAAERVGRICYGIEIDPLYVDVTIRRWQKLTGESAIHSASGRTFNDIESTAEKKNDQ